MVFHYDVIILHVGTLDLDQVSVQEFSKQYLSLVRVIAQPFFQAVDFRSGEKGKELDSKRKAFNVEVKFLSIFL